MRTFGFRGPVLQHFSISLDDKCPSMGRMKVVVLGTGQLASVLAGVAQLNFVWEYLFFCSFFGGKV